MLLTDAVAVTPLKLSVEVADQFWIPEAGPASMSLVVPETTVVKVLMLALAFEIVSTAWPDVEARIKPTAAMSEVDDVFMILVMWFLFA